MSTAAQIDFQLYVALLASELTRFSLPGVGSFSWHVERSHVDPKSGIVAPPRAILKHEPGHKYFHETVAFLRDHFGIDETEAEAVLREIGRLTAAYLRAAPEMDLWRLGKLKRVGGIYKVELSEEAVPPCAVDLVEVSLRAGAVSPVSALPKVVPSSEEGKGKEAPRARIKEPRKEAPTPTEETAYPAQPRRERRWLPLFGGLAVVAVILAGITFWLLRKRPAPQPVEITLSKPSSGGTSSAPAPPPSSTPSTAKDKPQSASAPATSSKEPSTAPSVSKAAPPPTTSSTAKEKPQPTPEPSSKESSASSPPTKGPRYYIIVGSYPSRAEAEQRAAQLDRYRVEYLPGKEPGWVRLSVFSSTDKAEVQTRLREIKAQIPDAWVFTSP